MAGRCARAVGRAARGTIGCRPGQHHHEWILEDLVAAGLSRDRLTSAIPDERILHLVGAQFALIATVHPTALLGYVLVLECQPHDRERLPGDANSLGVPPSALRTMLYHTEVDLEHRSDILALASKYAADRFCFAAMLTAASQTLSGWVECFRTKVEANAQS
jgi:hypothetical protein